jgi:hypothetical protein
VKHTPNAFAQTTLERDLRERGVDAIVVAGFITNNSVETTVRVAATLGFRVWVVRDATATFDRVDLDGRRLRAEEVHALSLSNMSGEYAEIVGSEDLLAARPNRPAARDVTPVTRRHCVRVHRFPPAFGGSAEAGHAFGYFGRATRTRRKKTYARCRTPRPSFAIETCRARWSGKKENDHALHDPDRGQ